MLVAPAACFGAALGFGAWRIVQDLLAGVAVITEQLRLRRSGATQLGSTNDAMGTVEDVPRCR